MKLTTIGTHADLVYFDDEAHTVLNSPAATGMSFWSINPYVGCAFACSYCYAPYAHRYAVQRTLDGEPGAEIRRLLEELEPDVAFSRRIMVKRNAAAVLRREVAQGRVKRAALESGEAVALGTATDPYQPAERRFRVTRSILEVLATLRSIDLSITTKSPLVARDADVLRDMARRSSVSVHMSLITVDRALARRLEPRAPTPESRLRAIRCLRDSGVDVGVNVMPVLPGITDTPQGMEALVQAVAEAGAQRVYAGALRLRRTARARYLPVVAREFPELSARYAASYSDSFNVSERYRAGLRRRVAELCEHAGIQYGARDENKRAGSLMPEQRNLFD
ncbi:MAG: radical SAM protein [Gemmatimonadaceae bacterium]